MGAWDYGIMEDDAAADLKSLWDEYVVRGVRADPDFWTAERITDFFQTLYFRHRSLAERDVDVGTLALGLLLHDSGMRLPAPLTSRIAHAASAELSRERLAMWDSPIRRKRAVVKLLATLGIEPQAPPPTRDRVREEVEKWRIFARQYRRWVEVSTTGPFGKPDEFFDLVPSWFGKFQIFLGAGLYHKNPKITAEAVKFRLMHVAWWFGFLLQLPVEERLALIRVAEERGGSSFMNATPGTASP